jgi:DNA/RNA-binding domain of Phe-tRNA-synthetase-like protein
MSGRVHVAERWRSDCRGAKVGVLGMHKVANPNADASLDARGAQLQSEILASLSGRSRAELKQIPTIQAYADYYKRFGKTYHVQLQLESILFKGKRIAGPSALVQAMFMAELKNMLLTAGHDLGGVRGDLTVDVATGTERYTLLGGGEQPLKPGDMFIRDEESILSSIIYGPDERTRVTSETCAVLFTVYAPAGIRKEELETHLSDLEANVRMFSPYAEVESREVVEAE